MALTSDVINAIMAGQMNPGQIGNLLASPGLTATDNVFLRTAIPSAPTSVPNFPIANAGNSSVTPTAPTARELRLSENYDPQLTNNLIGREARHNTPIGSFVNPNPDWMSAQDQNAMKEINKYFYAAGLPSPFEMTDVGNTGNTGSATPAPAGAGNTSSLPSDINSILASMVPNAIAGARADKSFNGLPASAGNTVDDLMAWARGLQGNSQSLYDQIMAANAPGRPTTRTLDNVSPLGGASSGGGSAGGSGIVPGTTLYGPLYQGQGSAVPPRTVADDQRDYRAPLQSQLRAIFNDPNYASSISDTLDDPIIDEILNANYGTAQRNLDRSRARGTLTGGGYNAAIANLDAQRGGVRDRLSTIGSGIIEGGRTRLRELGESAFDAVGAALPGDQFSTSGYGGRFDSIVNDITNNFRDRFTGQVGTAPLFDTNTATQLGGAEQGITSGAESPLLVAQANRARSTRDRKRGIGSTGSF